ncbi:MAG TPA: hypothetical protein VN372_05305 [Methanospirillum sp.]|nr:hypothetical protein [Methanospirillum sp.]
MANHLHRRGRWYKNTTAQIEENLHTILVERRINLKAFINNKLAEEFGLPKIYDSYCTDESADSRIHCATTAYLAEFGIVPEELAHEP